MGKLLHSRPRNKSKNRWIMSKKVRVNPCILDLEISLRIAG